MIDSKTTNTTSSTAVSHHARNHGDVELQHHHQQQNLEQKSTSSRVEEDQKQKNTIAMGLSDDDLSLGSTVSLPNSDDNTRTSSDNDISNEYIPDNIKDIFAEADAAINACVMMSPAPTSQDSNYNTPSMQATTTCTNKNNTLFSPSYSDVRGPYDTDMGEECRTNPVSLYQTESAVKRIALNDDPNVCPDHGDSCSCHLKESMSTYTINRMTPPPPKLLSNVGIKSVNDLYLHSPLVVEADNKDEKKLDMMTNNTPQLSSSSTLDNDNDLGMDIEENHDDNENMFLPTNWDKNKEEEMEGEEDISLESYLTNMHDQYYDGNQQDTSFNSTNSNDNDDDDLELDDEDEIFLPKLRHDSYDIPQCNTMKKSNTTTSTKEMKTMKVVESKPTIASKMEKNISRSGPRKLTIPKSPDLVTKKLHGPRRYSGLGVKNDNNDEDDNIKQTITTTARNNLETNNKKGKTTANKIPGVDKQQKNLTTPKLTVPKSPKLYSKEKLGERSYSVVGKRQEGDEKEKNGNKNHLQKPSVDTERTDYKTKPLTVPKAPNLASTKKLGERVYSAVGSNKAIKEIDSDRETGTAMTTTKIDYKNKALTIPKAPALLSTQKLGERRYSAIGNHHETVPVVEVIVRKEILLDYKNKAPTIPKAPKLSICEKMGPRQYSIVGSRKEKKEHKENDKTRDVISYKSKALTVPHAPKLHSTEKLGERQYSAVGKREEKVEEVFSTLDWTNRKVTIPKAPLLSTLKRFEREDTSEEDPKPTPFVFKALPIMAGVIEGPKPTKHTIKKKSPTVPKPFHFKIEERIPDHTETHNKFSLEKKGSPVKAFRARPVPDFSCPEVIVKKTSAKPLTQPAPFNLKTTKLSSSHRKAKTGSNNKGRRVRRFRARPVPNFSNPPMVLKGSTKPLTQPAPFNLKTTKLSSSPRKEKSTFDEKGSQDRNFRARPVPNFSRPAATITTCDKPLTKPVPFHFKTAELPESPRRKRIPPAKRVLKSSSPNDLAHLASPQKKRKVTIPKPFHLSCGNRSLPSPPAPKESTPTHNTKRDVVIPTAPPVEKRSTTKLRPFKLSSSNIKSKSLEKESVNIKSKSPEKESTYNVSELSPSTMATHQPTKIDKDNCPIEFRRNLILISAKNQRESGKNKDSRDIQARSVVDQLEQLSTLVQQTVI